MDKNPCTALVKYEPTAFQTARAGMVLANGHRFRREAQWLCACGMRWPRGVVRLLPCTALSD